MKIYTFEEWRARPRARGRHCWLRLQRHTWEWHLGMHNICAYATCKDCGWPGTFYLVKD